MNPFACVPVPLTKELDLDILLLSCCTLTVPFPFLPTHTIVISFNFFPLISQFLLSYSSFFPLISHFLLISSYLLISFLSSLTFSLISPFFLFTSLSCVLSRHLFLSSFPISFNLIPSLSHSSFLPSPASPHFTFLFLLSVFFVFFCGFLSFNIFSTSSSFYFIFCSHLNFTSHFSSRLLPPSPFLFSSSTSPLSCPVMSISLAGSDHSRQWVK